MSNQQVQKVKVKRLAHVGVWTADVTSQARFYHQVLGLEVRSTSENGADDVLNLKRQICFWLWMKSLIVWGYLTIIVSSRK